MGDRHPPLLPGYRSLKALCPSAIRRVPQASSSEDFCWNSSMVIGKRVDVPEHYRWLAWA
jgi:hypothetical protein